MIETKLKFYSLRVSEVLCSPLQDYLKLIANKLCLSKLLFLSSDGVGKEVVTQYVVEGMDTNSTFYTDSNGREMIERVLNYRPTYNLTLEEPIAGNYFPVNTRISIKDSTKQVSVVTDRSHGASSLEDGEIELMVSYVFPN